LAKWDRSEPCPIINTIRLWDLNTSAEIARIEADALIACLTALPAARLIAGDNLGSLHWLEVVD
jgi:hypothetical protein